MMTQNNKSLHERTLEHHSRMSASTILTAFCTAMILFFMLYVNANAQMVPYSQEKIIVKVSEDLSQAEIDALMAEMGATLDYVSEVSGIQVWLVSGVSVNDASVLYANDARIDYIGLDYELTVPDDEIGESGLISASALNSALATTPNDARFAELWGLNNTGQSGGTNDADIDAPEAWDTLTDSTMVVAVIDTGVDYTHPDLANVMWTNPGEIAGNGIDDDGNGYVDDIHGYDWVNNDGDPIDDHNHGTHVAGTIAAEGNNSIGVVGVNWSAQIMALKFLSSSGSGSTSNAIRAIDYATMMGANMTNNSWGCGPGGCFSQAMEDSIQAANDAGVLFIAAAGNDNNNNDNTPTYPASYDVPNVIAVAATDRNDNRSSFSSYGATTVDLGAPGSSILSTVRGNGYSSFNGTSMATPHVAGAAALLWQHNPSWSAAQVKDCLLDSVDPTSAMNGRTLSGGRLNINNALACEGSEPTPTDGLLDIADDVTVNVGEFVQVPVSLTNGTDGIASMAFSVDYDENCLVMDATDRDEDGIPDAIAFNVPGLYITSAMFDASDTDGEIDISIFDQVAPLTAMPDGLVMTMTFSTTCAPSDDTPMVAPIVFSSDPAASFGSTNGMAAAATTSDGSVVIMPNAPAYGDCNGDGTVDVADMICLTYEIFDGDGTDPANTPGGSYAGTPLADANDDSSVDGADYSCMALIIFGGECGGAVAAASVSAASVSAASVDVSRSGRAIVRQTGSLPVLDMDTAAMQIVNNQLIVPVNFDNSEVDISAVAFSIDYDATVLSFNGEDADLDGNADGVTFNVPAAFRPSATYDASDEDGELDLLVMDYSLPIATLPNGQIATITFDIIGDISAGTAIRFSQTPAASFSTTMGESVLGVTEDVPVTIEAMSDVTADDPGTGSQTEYLMHLPLVFQ